MFKCHCHVQNVHAYLFMPIDCNGNSDYKRHDNVLNDENI